MVTSTKSRTGLSSNGRTAGWHSANRRSTRLSSTNSLSPLSEARHVAGHETEDVAEPDEHRDEHDRIDDGFDRRVDCGDVGVEEIQSDTDNHKNQKHADDRHTKIIGTKTADSRRWRTKMCCTGPFCLSCAVKVAKTKKKSD